ncbi:Retrovirus-related Pol polyprotein from transposon 17.6 [Araneus ventricosus]|uniref:Retrovirus-related Pol polyprotein from transposon 17.6 n=1 Tax=Araneus ventricosus TaxID=182803 RepID=A0A4Y2PF21_ARAVE|nr:Retrovirus-related Pol polyprotein from transposon 17.6 [Araneus ventricosus]
MSTISVDSSQYGLGAVLLQEDHPIAYASSSLTETQQRYSQIEKELSDIVIGCKKFHYYVYGTKFVIETDHKNLIDLLPKPMDKLSPRLQRMVLELFKYNLQLRHVSGKSLYVADALSRNPLKCHEDTSFLEAGAAVVHTVSTASDEKT